MRFSIRHRLSLVALACVPFLASSDLFAQSENLRVGFLTVRTGPLATFEALAIDDYMLTSKTPLITPTSAAQMDLAQQGKSDYVIHVYGTAAQPMHVLGQYAAKDLGLKRITTVADDFTYGHEGTAGFHHVFEDNGGKIVQKLWPPLNVADYGS